MATARTLVIAINGERVGSWSLAGGVHHLRYAAGWLNSPRARPLSLSLPLLPATESHRGERVSNWFDNLLPDDPGMRERMRRAFATTSTGTFDLLEAVGRDCVGAVQLLPAGEALAALSPAQGRRLDEAGVAGVLRDAAAGRVPGRQSVNPFRISIAGAQTKTALLRIGDDWYEPDAQYPTTHIFKLPLGRVASEDVDLSSSVQNEWVCARLFDLLELSTAVTTMARFEDRIALVVERFDRRLASDGATLLRLPQEDLCQAFGLPSSEKYEADGGPGIEQTMALLGASRTAVADRQRFFESQLLFWALAAPDGHAKNFSLFLEPGGRYRLTPLYDILSMLPYIGPTLAPQKLELAMGWHGRNRRYRWSETQPRHLLGMADRTGFGDALHASLERLTRSLPAALNALGVEAANQSVAVPAVVIDSIGEGAIARLSAARNALD